MGILDQLLVAVETSRLKSASGPGIGGIGQSDPQDENQSAAAASNSLNLNRFTSQQLAQLWREALNSIRERLRVVFADDIQQVDPSADGEELNGEHLRADQHLPSDEDKISALRSIDDIVRIVEEGLVALPPQHTTDQIWPIVFTLHDLLLSFPRHPLVRTQDLVCNLCELWWQQERRGREEIVPQAVSWLLMKSLGVGGKIADAKHVCNVKEMLLVFDWEDESAETIKVLVGHCFHKSTYLKSPEGKKFLVFALSSLSLGFVDEIHEFVKAQLPYCEMPLVLTYGEIYFKAWKAAAEDFRSRIETSCIQSLMRHAIHAPPKIAIPAELGGGHCAFFNRLRAALGKFHEQKSQRGVDTMLCNLYEPLLWRGLYAANEQVRKNSLCLMVDAFPLLDQNAELEERDELLVKQYDILKTFLRDDCPAIRVEAVKGICRILTGLWELVPLAVAEGFINVVIGELGFDMGDAGVRVAVIESIGHLLQKQVKSHDVLKDKLPVLHSLINDSAEKVRVQMMNLLLLLTKHRVIRFYDVVPIDDLINRLANDPSPQVRKRAARVLMATYFPESQQPGEKISRCREFLIKDTVAAQAFFYYVPKLAKANHVASFVIALCKLLALLSSDAEEPTVAEGGGEKRKRRKKDTRVHASGLVDERTKTQFMPFFEHFLDILAITLDSLMKEKQRDAKVKDSIQQSFAEAQISHILTKCDQDSAKDALASITSHFSAEQVRKMGFNPDEFDNPTNGVGKLKAFGSSDKNLDSIVHQLVTALSGLSVGNGEASQSDRGGARGKRRSRTDGVTSVHSNMTMLEAIMSDQDLRKGLFASDELTNIAECLKSAMENTPSLVLNLAAADPVAKLEIGDDAFYPILDLLENHVKEAISTRRSTAEPKGRGRRGQRSNLDTANKIDDVSTSIIKLCLEYTTLGFCSQDEAKRVIRGCAAIVDSDLIDTTYLLKILDQTLLTALDEPEVDDELCTETLDLTLKVSKAIVGSRNVQTLSLLRQLLTDTVRVLSRHGRLSSFAHQLIRITITPSALSSDESGGEADTPSIHPVLQTMYSVFAIADGTRDSFIQELRSLVAEMNSKAAGVDGSEEDDYDKQGKQDMKDRIKEFAGVLTEKTGETDGLRQLLEVSA
ncbi:hypothetical protein M427DRAFT_142851 [Gonapodya prolifera JEL478]|uniref:Uncharacterized protein n=1 Tax=Gonapodya prolifera (strain JEL478) TaxID=1344416 RepID=A0A139AW19_GONPJ|nr:hypothetical protein M427DRAFT_142851 [Gonapodya prolifera JEL478]|eukprot:KXS20665.1 hypothetical protein M427DRAFT_142851 [Gonapodya prolifera JEL478]